MPVIEPVPTEYIDPDLLGIFEQAIADDRLASLRYPQIVAYSSNALRNISRGYGQSAGSLISARLKELIRLRSAQLGGCAECQSARYDESVNDDTAACVLTDWSALEPAEAVVMRFVTLMHTDHHAIDGDLYLELAEHYSTGEIVEIGLWTGQTLGSHRFIHTIDLLGDAAPILKFDPDQIDRVRFAVGASETA